MEVSSIVRWLTVTVRARNDKKVFLSRKTLLIIFGHVEYFGLIISALEHFYQFFSHSFRVTSLTSPKDGHWCRGAAGSGRCACSSEGICKKLAQPSTLFSAKRGVFGNNNTHETKSCSIKSAQNMPFRAISDKRVSTEKSNSSLNLNMNQINR